MSDTLQIDSTQIAAWQSNSRYDYDREIVGGSENLLEWITSLISRWINETFNTVVDNDVVYYTLVALGCALVIFLGWLVWRKRVKLFYRKEKEDAMDYELEEDTIYGVDFDADIREALAHEDYRQAVRLLYLQTLLYLQNEGKIDWQPSKTPEQYMRQVNLQPFTQMTRQFVLVRYGNFDATETLFQQMKSLQTAVMGKGGDANEQ